MKSQKYKDLLEDLSKEIVSLLSKHKKGLAAKKIFSLLELPPSFSNIFNDLLAEAVKKKTLHKKKELFFLNEKPPSPLYAVGTLKTHPRGFGFVQPEGGKLKEVFIPPSFLMGAVDGDKVEVLIDESKSSPRGPEGRVSSILERTRTALGGTIEAKTKKGYLLFSPLISAPKKIYLQTPLHLERGDRVLVKIEKWKNEEDCILTSLIKKMGNISDPSIDIEATIEEFQLRSDFSHELLKEAEKFGKEVKKKDLKERRDLTGLNCITIDPKSSRDFDDALTITKDRKGHFHLGVHIADVAHYIQKDSPLDREAQLRANSIYFPEKCIPMLPENLSNNLCSLKPNVERLTISILMDFDTEGNLLSYEICRSFIKSKKRFTYEEAFALLDQKEPTPLTPLLQTMGQLALLLKKKRFERGSIDLALPDVEIVIDSKGDPLGIELHEYDLSHQLVEEFMLKANEMIAKHLNQKEKMLLYRIHEAPTKEDFQDFASLARSMGFEISDHPTQTELQEFFKKAKETSFFHQLSVSFIKSMRLAIYSPQNAGHYGLALEHYCHFTSPIRRYSDLIAERLLFDEEGTIDLHEAANHCSVQERNAFRAENRLLLLKKLRLLQKNLKRDSSYVYTALITRIKPFGLFCDIEGYYIDGFIHISEIGNDYFVFSPATSSLKGEHTKKKYRVGDKISLRLIRIDLITLETQWKITEGKVLQKK
jgi:ribonuclease R